MADAGLHYDLGAREHRGELHAQLRRHDRIGAAQEHKHVGAELRQPHPRRLRVEGGAVRVVDGLGVGRDLLFLRSGVGLRGGVPASVGECASRRAARMPLGDRRRIPGLARMLRVDGSLLVRRRQAADGPAARRDQHELGYPFRMGDGVQHG